MKAKVFGHAWCADRDNIDPYESYLYPVLTMYGRSPWNVSVREEHRCRDEDDMNAVAHHNIKDKLRGPTAHSTKNDTTYTKETTHPNCEVKKGSREHTYVYDLTTDVAYGHIHPSELTVPETDDGDTKEMTWLHVTGWTTDTESPP